MRRAIRWANRLKYVCAGLILIGVIGLAATMLPDYEYELWRAYLFAGIALTGFAGQLVCALIVFSDWIRSEEHQKEMFDWARRWKMPFVWLMLGGVSGRALLGEALKALALAEVCQTAAEIGLICFLICVIALAAEKRMKRLEKVEN